MGKREPQIILKTEERDICRNSGTSGNSQPNQAVGMKTGFSSRATSSRSLSRSTAGCSRTSCGPATGGRTAPMLFSGRLKRRCDGGDTLTETACNGGSAEPSCLTLGRTASAPLRACGAFIAVLRNHAEIVLAHAQVARRATDPARGLIAVRTSPWLFRERIFERHRPDR